MQYKYKKIKHIHLYIIVKNCIEIDQIMEYFNMNINFLIIELLFCEIKIG